MKNRICRALLVFLWTIASAVTVCAGGVTDTTIGTGTDFTPVGKMDGMSLVAVALCVGVAAVLVIVTVLKVKMNKRK